MRYWQKKQINSNYYYFNKTKKVKSKLIFIYTDKCLKKQIFVLDSNLPRQSYNRKQFLLEFDYNFSTQNVTIFKHLSSKLNIFYTFPSYYLKSSFKKRKIWFNFLIFFYKNFIQCTISQKKKREIILNKKCRYSKQNWYKFLFKTIIKGKVNASNKNILVIDKKVKEIKRWYKKRFYITYRGNFIMVFKKDRVRPKYKMFRKPLRSVYPRFSKLILLWAFKGQFLISHLLKGKILIYKSYLKYYKNKFITEFKKINPRRLRWKGPFWPFFIQQRCMGKYLLKTLRASNKTKLKENYFSCSLIFYNYYVFFNYVYRANLKFSKYQYYILFLSQQIISFKNKLPIFQYSEISLIEERNFINQTFKKKFRSIRLYEEYTIRKKNIEKKRLMKIKRLKENAQRKKGGKSSKLKWWSKKYAKQIFYFVRNKSINNLTPEVKEKYITALAGAKKTNNLKLGNFLKLNNKHLNDYKIFQKERLITKFISNTKTKEAEELNKRFPMLLKKKVEL